MELAQEDSSELSKDLADITEVVNDSGKMHIRFLCYEY